MRVSEIMSRDVPTVPVDATLVEAAELMRDYRIGFLPVTSSDAVVGVVTDRDLIVRGICKASDLDLTPVRSIMSNWPVYCYEDDVLTDAADTLASNHLHRLIVLDQNKKLCGLISIDDLPADVWSHGSLADPVHVSAA